MYIILSAQILSWNMADLVLFGCSCLAATSILRLVWKAKFSQLAALTFLNSKYVTRHNMLYFIFEPCQKYGEETTFILSWMEMKNIIENKKKFIEWNLTKWLYHETSSVYDIHLKEITNLRLLFRIERLNILGYEIKYSLLKHI